MIVMALRTDGNHRYSWTKNKRSPFVSWTRPRTLRRSTISGISEGERQAYRAAVDETLARCTPLPLSYAFGSVIAGRPINVRFH
jgi:hypothetical protein